MRSSLFSLLAFTFVLALGNMFPASGQTRTPTTSSGVKIGEKFYEMRDRANELTRIKEELSKPEARSPEASFPKIKKDFEKLQIVNTEKLQKNSIGSNLNYKLIADAAQEINNRAVKLKSGLFPEEKPEKPIVKIPETLTAEDFQKLIIALDNAVYRFVSNPMFQNTKLVAPLDSQAAQKELNKIIILSDILETNAEKMK